MSTLCPNCNTRPITPGYQFCSKTCATAATPQFLGQNNQQNNPPPPAYSQAPPPMAQPPQPQPAQQSGGATGLLGRFLGSRGGSSSQPQHPPAPQFCVIPGCGRPVYRDTTGTPSLYCGRKHMQQGQQMGLGQQAPAGAPAPGMTGPQSTGQPQTSQQGMMGHQPMASQGGTTYPYMQPGQQGMAYAQQPGVYPQTNQQPMAPQPGMGYPQMGQQQPPPMGPPPGATYPPAGPQPGATYPQMSTQPSVGYQQMGQPQQMGPQPGAGYPQMGQPQQMGPQSGAGYPHIGQPQQMGSQPGAGYPQMSQAPGPTYQPPGTCQFQNCPKPVYVDTVTKKPSLYCSRTHMRMATGQQAPVPPTQNAPPGPPGTNPQYNSGNPTWGGMSQQPQPPQPPQPPQGSQPTTLYPNPTGAVTPAQQYAASFMGSAASSIYQPAATSFNPQQPVAHGNASPSSEGTASPPPQPLSTGSLLQMCFLCRSKPPLPNDFFCSPDCRVRGKKFAHDILDNEMPIHSDDTDTMPEGLSEEDVDEFGLPLHPPTTEFATHTMSTGMDIGLVAEPLNSAHMVAPVYAQMTGISGNTASAYSGYDRSVPPTTSTTQALPPVQQYQTTATSQATRQMRADAPSTPSPAPAMSPTPPTPAPAPSQSPPPAPAPAPIQQQYQPQYQQQQYQQQQQQQQQRQQPAYKPYVPIPSGYVGHIEDDGGSWSPDETDPSVTVSHYKGSQNPQQQQQQQQQQQPPAAVQQPGMNTTVGYGTAAYSSYGAAPANPAGGAYPYAQQHQAQQPHQNQAQQPHYQQYVYPPAQPVNEDSMPD